MKSVYDPWVSALFEGVDGAEVVQRMRTYYQEISKSGALNDCTLRTKVSEVKRRFMDEYEEIGRGMAKSERKMSKACRDALAAYAKGLKNLEEAAKEASAKCRGAVKEFGALPVRSQVREVRYRDHPKRDRQSLCEPFGDDLGVKAAFAALVVLPTNLETLQLLASETQRCAKKTSMSMLRRPKTVIPSLGKFIDAVNAALRAPELDAKGRLSEPHLVIACLLAACGRRTTEVMSWRSTFEELKGFDSGCVFSGQLKTRGSVSGAYKIPLLVPFTSFRNALNHLRTWQGTDAAQLTNKQISVRYQGGLSKWFASQKNLGGIKGVHPHLLRAIYMAVVLKVFNWGSHWDKRIAKYCLGHAEKETTYHYDFIEITSGAKKYSKRFGVFPLSEAELRASEG